MKCRFQVSFVLPVRVQFYTQQLAIFHVKVSYTCSVIMLYSTRWVSDDIFLSECAFVESLEKQQGYYSRYAPIALRTGAAKEYKASKLVITYCENTPIVFRNTGDEGM